ncbi:MAG: polyphenol oxidase family protein [Candidatus Omnitrophica bacterium]|nr:polyphenol oxidase family protein [Candidatus Omnitrophota bacterium]
MKLIEKDYCYIIDDFFDYEIIAGFTKPVLAGNPAQDIYAALKSLNSDFAVSYLKQVHSSTIHYISSEGVYVGDGLFSSRNKLALIVKTADCMPLFFASAQQGTVGMVHMGWRSAWAGILGNIPKELASFKVIAGVGLRPCCYKVGEEFLNYRQFSSAIERKNNEVYFNPIRFTRETLLMRGLKEENFLDTGICSVCSKEKCFSFRRDATTSRTLSFILKK